ncbi:PREDICTED: uncharacterized protein LOC105368944 [Ceratosolen solmsi marchali]|uniref:Uncharacterized protein LOC105368944 n=1 Tax=Ceratosolen solmsi marchali TaxID=326594 RepID=A0AAJ6YXZ0_9HYME|nr:PREDICTED: uncharacterized protein LOC105368944 [Ceratosolen solmsi marchali]
MVTTHGHDVTMLRLETEVLDVQPAVIATVRKEDLFGLRVDLAGWPQPSLTRSFNIKEKANIKIISDDVCVQKLLVFNRRPNFQDNLFCTFTDPYVLMSNVNSGGPVLHDNKIIGVNKKTYPATEPEVDPRKVNIHFNLGYYLGFIHDIISKC